MQNIQITRQYLSGYGMIATKIEEVGVKSFKKNKSITINFEKKPKFYK